VSRPVNAPDGWILLLTGPGEYVEMEAGRLRHEGFRVVTRHSPAGLGSRLGGGWQKELLVPILAEPRARRLLEHPPTTIYATARMAGSEGWEPEVIDSGEAPLETLSDLFDAASRLVHSPWSVRGAEDLARATDAMTDCRPPYGFEGDVWESASQTASRLLELIGEGASVDSISQTAERLRAVLRDQL
jgi:hypothetical protein